MLFHKQTDWLARPNTSEAGCSKLATEIKKNLARTKGSEKIRETNPGKLRKSLFGSYCTVAMPCVPSAAVDPQVFDTEQNLPCIIYQTTTRL
jgi:hypothetical protein